MKSLSLLTQKIREWNSMGLSLLPSLQIAIIHSNSYQKQIIHLLDLIQCKQLLYDEKYSSNLINKTQNKTNQSQQLNQSTNQIKTNQKQQSTIINNQTKPIQTQIQTQQTKNKQQSKQTQQIQQILQKQQLKQGQQTKQLKQAQQTKQSKQKKQIKQKYQSQIIKWDNRLIDSIYAIYLTHEVIEARIHLIIDQQIGGRLDDQSLKISKKIIQRLKRNRSIIFINFNTSTYKLDTMSQHIQQFGLSYKTKQRQIKADHLIQSYKQKYIQNKYISIHINCKHLNKSNQSQQHKQHSNSIQFNKSLSKQINQSSINLSPNSLLYPPINPEFTQHIREQLNSFFPINSPNFTIDLFHQIEKKYIHLFGLQINKNFNQMKSYHKQILTQLKRYDGLMQLIQKQTITNNQGNQIQNQKSAFKKQTKLTTYGLNCLYKSKEYLISSLMGTFSNIQIYRSKKYNKKRTSNNLPTSTRRSLHWQIMQIMNQIWQIQGDVLLKQLQKMPLSYIKERYKMLDYQTLSGFMPSSCFESIFAGPLKNMVEQIMETLQIVQLKILTQTKNVIQYFFCNTNVCEQLSQMISQQIKQLCLKFKKQTYKVLKSQIQFISVSSQQFWSFKQVKSNLYAPDQQIYIQIKYIGKNYVKKVFDNIRETLPRLIGQNLLKQIVNCLQTNTLQIFTHVVIEKGIDICVTQREKIWLQKIKISQKKIDKLVYFFSLKTSSQTGVKNLHQNLEKNWKRMFKNKSKYQATQIQIKQIQQKKGFLAWARNLIKRNKKQDKKRSLSQQKINNFQFKQAQNQNQNRQVNEPKKHSTLTQKNWLLIINIDKSVQQEKIQKSSQQGLPQRLRPSIWLYLAKKQISSQTTKVQALLNQSKNIINQQKIQLTQVFKQIDKDINRTPPPNLFRKGYLKDTITRILQAYSIHDKALRYTQGMNFIVGIILCVLTHYGENCQYAQQNSKTKTYFEILQNQCFMIFLYIMQKKGLRKIMFIQKATITDLCVRLQQYIRKKSAIMFEKIERSGFCVEMIFSGALISGLTTSQIQFKLQKRIVDLLLAYQFSILYKIIGQFVASSESLCQNMEGQNLYYFLKNNIYNEVYKQIGDEGLAKMFNNL